MRQYNSLLDYIPQRNHDYFIDFWNNGAIGSISDHTGRCIYRFHEHAYDDNGHLYVKSLNDEDAPVVALGVVAYWLHYRDTPNQAAAYGIKHKSIPEIFKDYTADRLCAYKKRHEQSPSSWRSDMERDFYTHHIIPSEKKLIKQSEALFEYITPDDQQLVRDVMKEYILYLQDKRDAYRPPVVKSKSVEKVKPVRVVEIEKIMSHFKMTFDKKTYSSTLKMFLEQPDSDKNLARVALLIYKVHPTNA